MSNVFLLSQQTQRHVHKYNHIHETHTTHNPPFLMMLGMRAGGDMKSVSMCIDAEKVKELQQNSEMKNNHEEHLPPFILLPFL